MFLFNNVAVVDLIFVFSCVKNVNDRLSPAYNMRWHVFELTGKRAMCMYECVCLWVHSQTKEVFIEA